MATLKELFNCLCTEEMIDNQEAVEIFAKGKEGYLVSYDIGLGFGMWAKDAEEGDEFELSEDEIEIRKGESITMKDLIDDDRAREERKPMGIHHSQTNC